MADAAAANKSFAWVWFMYSHPSSNNSRSVTVLVNMQVRSNNRTIWHLCTLVRSCGQTVLSRVLTRWAPARSWNWNLLSIRQRLYHTHMSALNLLRFRGLKCQIAV